MKNLLLRLTSSPNLYSLIILGVFLLLAWGSIEIYETEYKGDGIYEESYSDVYGLSTRTGKRDVQGRWQGKVVYEYTAAGSEDNFTEEVNYVDGIRQGWATQTYGNGSKIHYFYSNGMLTDVPVKSTVSGYDMLELQYPFVIFAFNGLGFSDAFIQAYTDTIEYILDTYTFNFEDFDSYYDDAIGAVNATRFDTIDQANANMASWDGIYPYKSDEFRLAMMDFYLDGEMNLYDIIVGKYPGYLSFMNLQTVSNSDFEGFCGQFEDSLATFPELNIEDPMLADSVDERIFAIIYAFNYPEKSAASLQSYKEVNVSSIKQRDLRQLLNDYRLKNQSVAAATPEEIGSIILNHMIYEYDQADFVRNAIRNAYKLNNSILSIPYVSTELVSHNSATSVTLKGYIVNDGGAIITSSGIAWGTSFNPTIDDNKLESDAQIGSFEEVLNNLTEGDTYYARTYASNSVGISYGNCLTFVAEQEVNSIQDPEKSGSLLIYPNPSTGLSTLKFTVISAGPVNMNIYDVKGRIVYTQNLGIRIAGENSIPLNVAHLKDGVYSCQVTVNNTRQTTRFILQR